MDDGEKHIVRLERSFEILRAIMPYANQNPNGLHRRDIQKAWMSLERRYWAYCFWLEAKSEENKNASGNRVLR